MGKNKKGTDVNVSIGEDGVVHYGKKPHLGEHKKTIKTDKSETEKTTKAPIVNKELATEQDATKIHINIGEDGVVHYGKKPHLGEHKKTIKTDKSETEKTTKAPIVNKELATEQDATKIHISIGEDGVVHYGKKPHLGEHKKTIKTDKSETEKTTKAPIVNKELATEQDATKIHISIGKDGVVHYGPQPLLNNDSEHSKTPSKVFGESSQTLDFHGTINLAKMLMVIGIDNASNVVDSFVPHNQGENNEASTAHTDTAIDTVLHDYFNDSHNNSDSSDH
jgi:hypothetical protein